MQKPFFISVLISSIFLGLLIVIQFSTDKPIESNFPLHELEARDNLLKSFIDDQSYLQSRIVNLRKQIDEAQNSIALQSENVNVDLLDSLKKAVGLTELSGPGLEIILDDSSLAYREGTDVTDILLVQASDIRDTINVLNAAHALGLSLNNQRVIATSPITSVGTTILVNNSHIAPPFVIQAIGDSEAMLQRLRDENSMIDLYRRFSQSQAVFEVALKDVINVPIYNGDLQDEYINLIEE